MRPIAVASAAVLLCLAGGASYAFYRCRSCGCPGSATISDRPVLEQNVTIWRGGTPDSRSSVLAPSPVPSSDGRRECTPELDACEQAYWSYPAQRECEVAQPSCRAQRATVTREGP